MDWAVLTKVGSRDINEDCVGIQAEDGIKVSALADGLGGHGSGDIASKIAVDCVCQTFKEWQGPDLRGRLAEAFESAQSHILAEQRKRGAVFQMKTTLAVLAVSGDEMVMGHIGDSRIYTFTHNRVKARTLDHSVPQMLVRAREIKEKDIRNHPDRNKLLRVLGVSGDNPRYELTEVQSIRKNQAFLLCSDGFWELIIEKEMSNLLRKTKSADEWLSEMCRIVELRGADKDMDNYSAIVVRVK